MMDRALQFVVTCVQACLTDELRNAPWRWHENRLAGHCYVASESVYWLCGGRDSGMTVKRVKMGDAWHWYLLDEDGTVVDPTAGQFDVEVPYGDGVSTGFLTGRPSKRARIVMDRVQRLIRD